MRKHHTLRPLRSLLPLVLGIGLLTLASARPGVWFRRLPARAAAKVCLPKPRPKPRPRLVAVNERVARRINTLRPTVKRRLQRVIRKLPPRVTLLVTSARRTREEQAALRSTFGVKAPPGRSTHEDGRAIDVNVLVDGVRVSPRLNQRIIGKAMASEGFRHLGPIDPVHYSLPKSEIDPNVTRGPLLEVPTLQELRAMEEAGTIVASTGESTPQP